MKSYYSRMNLPEPMVPAVQALSLLKGQTALVTGANSGIGRAIAIALGRAGANVVVNYVTRPEDAEAVVEEIRSKGQRAMIAEADVADEAQVQAMFAAAVREFGTIDILASNAGMERNAPFHEMSVAQWDAVMNVNLRGAFLCAREAVREFLRRGGGRQDHLHQLGPRGHSVGRPCELCRFEGRPDADDEEPRAGGCRKAHPRQLHRTGRDPHSDQRGGLVDTRCLCRTHEARAL